MTYSTIKLAGWKIKLADDFPSGFESAILSDVQLPDGQRSSFEKLTSSKFASVLKFSVLFRSKVYHLVLKRYLNRNFSDILKNFISTRAARAFKAGRMLREKGFSTPVAAALCQKSFAGFVVADFIIMTEIQGCLPFYELFGELAGAEKRALMEQFGQTVGRMHNQGFYHGDLRLGNVLTRKLNDKYEFVFLDNERTKKFNKLPMWLRVKNLVQAFMIRENMTEAEKACFFTAYFAQQQTSMDKNKLIEEVTSRTAKRLAAKGIISFV
jgi:tRNA A-37 threonylcarbamoyl transferase component Bud32